MKEDQVWYCKIGGPGLKLPPGADGPMRDAVEAAFRRLAGVEARACFSGWGQEWSEGEIQALTPPDETPLAPYELALFKSNGVKFTIDGEMRPIIASDGSYAGDSKHGAAELRWLANNGIWNPLRAKPTDNCASVGLAYKGKYDGKWVGWSHRAYMGFDTREEAAAFAESVS